MLFLCCLDPTQPRPPSPWARRPRCASELCFVFSYSCSLNNHKKILFFTPHKCIACCKVSHRSHTGIFDSNLGDKRVRGNTVHLLPAQSFTRCPSKTDTHRYFSFWMFRFVCFVCLCVFEMLCLWRPLPLPTVCAVRLGIQWWCSLKPVNGKYYKQILSENNLLMYSAHCQYSI